VAWPEGSGAVLKSVRSLKVLRCSWPVAGVLLSAEGDEAALNVELRDRGVADTDAVIAAACEADILVSERHLMESESFFSSWTWGLVAAAYMFGYHTDSFAGLEDEMEAVRGQDSGDLRLLAEEDGPLTTLPVVQSGGLANIVARRRSRRAFASQGIEHSSVAACLRVAFGLTGECVLKDGRTLPLTGAPSSGGLNTDEALLLSRAVSGLEEGTYRYLPQKHALARTEGSAVPFDRLFGGQAWCAEASCAIVLVSDLRRQASRYTFPTTISAALIEAGARIELLLLQAEEAWLSAVVVGLTGVGAFDRQLAEKAGLPCESSMIVPTCAVLLGSRVERDVGAS
jgi:hypothetical protein